MKRIVSLLLSLALFSSLVSCGKPPEPLTPMDPALEMDAFCFYDEGRSLVLRLGMSKEEIETSLEQELVPTKILTSDDSGEDQETLAYLYPDDSDEDDPSYLLFDETDRLVEARLCSEELYLSDGVSCAATYRQLDKPWVVQKLHLSYGTMVIAYASFDNNGVPISGDAPDVALTYFVSFFNTSSTASYVSLSLSQ